MRSLRQSVGDCVIRSPIQGSSDSPDFQWCPEQPERYLDEMRPSPRMCGGHPILLTLPASIVTQVRSLRVSKEPLPVVRNIFGDRHQRVRFSEDDSLTAAAYDPPFLPCAKEAADRVQRRAGHLGDVLT